MFQVPAYPLRSRPARPERLSAIALPLLVLPDSIGEYVGVALPENL